MTTFHSPLPSHPLFRQKTIFGVSRATSYWVQYSFLANRFKHINFDDPEQTDVLTKLLFCSNIVAFSKHDHPLFDRSFCFKNFLFVCLEEFLDETRNDQLGEFVERGVRGLLRSPLGWDNLVDISVFGHDIERMVREKGREIEPLLLVFSTSLHDLSFRKMSDIGNLANICFFLTGFQNLIKNIVLTKDKIELKQKIADKGLADVFLYDEQSVVPLFWININYILNKNRIGSAHLLDIAESFLTTPGINKNTSNQMVQFLGWRRTDTCLYLICDILKTAHEQSPNSLLVDMMTVLFLKNPYSDALLCDDDFAAKSSIDDATSEEMFLLAKECSTDIRSLVEGYTIFGDKKIPKSLCREAEKRLTKKTMQRRSPKIFWR